MLYNRRKGKEGDESEEGVFRCVYNIDGIVLFEG